MKKIILGVTGSIAAYRAAELASRLAREGFDVHAVMTAAATGFITPLTMQSLTRNRVYVGVLQEDDPSQIVHVNLPQSADLFLVAPATANTIGRIAHGIADDMLTSMALAACDIPMLIAPAMNTRMYENTAVRENLEVLKHRGWRVIEPKEDRLACGIVGRGALADVGVIVSEIRSALGETG